MHLNVHASICIYIQIIVIQKVATAENNWETTESLGYLWIDTSKQHQDFYLSDMLNTHQTNIDIHRVKSVRIRENTN